jgi:hypothetical protein
VETTIAPVRRDISDITARERSSGQSSSAAHCYDAVGRAIDERFSQCSTDLTHNRPQLLAKTCLRHPGRHTLHPSCKAAGRPKTCCQFGSRVTIVNAEEH